MKLRLASLAIFTALAVSSPALAQGDDMSPARLEKLDQEAAELKLSVNHAKAMDIARAKGVATVREMKLTKRGNWKVEGTDAQGHKIEVRIDGKNGKVEKVERE
jgi:uncharacterized membrane protein YkoI